MQIDQVKIRLWEGGFNSDLPVAKIRFPMHTRKKDAIKNLPRDLREQDQIRENEKQSRFTNHQEAGRD
ncbi:hypothetical protein [Moorena sp. SIO3B2]|uniref:hypothetical protein n=1 Tax=Moorena sp. SIO3B2 TaxID=2607827 RepID=UPI0013CB73AF|nr:hypothetical protein [Moorena sp. SIO3B2]NEP34279.1 hypothetical protein [Moorena sp. SIO3B2]